MPGEDDLYLNGVGRAQSIYQQPSTGEKHVLFYPTSPAPSANSEERRSWSQASSSFTNTHSLPKEHRAPYCVSNGSGRLLTGLLVLLSVSGILYKSFD